MRVAVEEERAGRQPKARRVLGGQRCLGEEHARARQPLDLVAEERDPAETPRSSRIPFGPPSCGPDARTDARPFGSTTKIAPLRLSVTYTYSS